MTTAFQTLRDPALLRRHLYIDGQWVAGDGAPLAVHNPASGELLGTVSTASPDLVDQAIAAAAAALPPRRPCRPGGPSRPNSVPPSCAAGTN